MRDTEKNIDKQIDWEFVTLMRCLSDFLLKQQKLQVIYEHSQKETWEL